MEMQLLTVDEKAKLEAELKRLVERRPVISAAIAEAREKGDLKENADYHAARDEMAHNEARIKNLEQRLRSATVVDTGNLPEDIVFLGSVVQCKDLKGGDIETFKLVGELSGNDSDDYMEVSAKSPLGEALMRARVGQQIRVSLPKGGEIKYEIVKLL